MANKRERQAMLHRELKEYEATISDLTVAERKELREWVAKGNSVYDNGYYMAGEDGNPTDYITANRITADMVKNPQDYNFGCSENTPSKEVEAGDEPAF
jgi:hypothetical protein